MNAEEVKNCMGEDVQISNGQPPAWKRISLLHAIEGKIRTIEDWLNLCSVFIIMFLMFFATAEILGRYLFNSPIPGHVEIVELIMAGVVFFGIAYTERVGGHVRMELFVTRVLKGRAYHIAEVITATLSLFVYLFILVYTFKASVFAFQMGDNTAYLYWPTWPSKVAIPLGSLFLCIRFAIEIIQHSCQAIAGTEMRDLD
jgi:TRAP-type C4-dicarboxylate transport system permease small subunit